MPPRCSPQRHAGAPRGHVAQRLVDRADDLRERARLAALDRHHAACAARASRGRRRVVATRAREQRREQAVDERARCSAPTWREVREHLAPAPRAVARARARTNTAGRFVIAPNALATGVGDRRAQHPAVEAVDASGHAYDLIASAGALRRRGWYANRSMRGLRIALAVLALAAAGHAFAQPYPSKPIRLIVPFPPGGAVDFYARVVQQPLSEALGPAGRDREPRGASGMVGTDLVAKSPPDGYTLLLGNIASLAINVGIYAKMPYDPSKDLTPIIAHDRRQLRAGRASVGAGENVAELIALREGESRQALVRLGGQRQPAASRASSSSRRRPGPTCVHVPYKGGGPMVTDLLGGTVQVVIADQANLMPHVQGGKLRALAVASPKRSTNYPELPTIARARLARLPGDRVERAGRPRGTAARRRREASNDGVRQGDGDARGAREAGGRRARPGRRHARRVRRASSAPRSPSGRRSRSRSARGPTESVRRVSRVQSRERRRDAGAVDADVLELALAHLARSQWSRALRAAIASRRPARRRDATACAIRASVGGAVRAEGRVRVHGRGFRGVGARLAGRARAAAVAASASVRRATTSTVGSGRPSRCAARRRARATGGRCGGRGLQRDRRDEAGGGDGGRSEQFVDVGHGVLRGVLVRWSS